MSRRVVICAAVSTADKNQDPESQVKPLVAVCDRLGWTVAEILRFKQSRFDPASEKEVHDAALQPIIEGRADTLAVWAWDRISRGDGEAAFAFIGRLEKHLGASFYSLQEPFLCTASDPEVRKLLLPIIAWVANLESGRKSKRMVAKADNKREVAERLGQRARWGRGSMPTLDDRRRIHDMRQQTPRPSLRAIETATGIPLATVHAVLEQPRPEGLVREPAAEQPGHSTEEPRPAAGGGFEHGHR
jgi:DNA invertase Pin-like site-specific DNA recombinase